MWLPIPKLGGEPFNLTILSLTRFLFFFLNLLTLCGRNKIHLEVEIA